MTTFFHKLVNGFYRNTAVSAVNPMPVGGGDIVVKSAVISNAGSLSAAVDLVMARLARIVIPATFEGASLTFQSSPDGVTYNNVYNDAGSEYTVTCAVGRSITINLADFIGIRYLKVRSGTSGTPTVVAADRTLTLVLVP